MSAVPAGMRAAIEERARRRCEYCHVSTRGQVTTFPVDHVQPISAGGPTEEDNLALTCPWCNGGKWLHTEGIDSETGLTVPLFNPRADTWSEHFEWSVEQVGVLIGRTPRARATLARLGINEPYRAETRRLLASLGLLDEALASES